ncbi:17421_t:CDS:2 [Gigaspora rosea]|nr:17421_t:CDS:2 [Gigaspora rosea]
MLVKVSDSSGISGMSDCACICMSASGWLSKSSQLGGGRDLTWKTNSGIVSKMWFLLKKSVTSGMSACSVIRNFQRVGICIQLSGIDQKK